MKTLATLLALTLSTCAPAHANPMADAAVQMCNGFTQVVQGYVETGISREENDKLVNAIISEPDLRDILMGMLDIADEGEYTGFSLELKVQAHCIRSATDMIVAAR